MPSRSKLATASAGGFGGVFPSLFILASTLTRSPETVSGGPWVLTYLVGLALWAVLGGFIALVFKEVNLRKAFFLGLGLPSLLQAHNSALNKPLPQKPVTVPPAVTLLLAPVRAEPAYAQPPDAGTGVPTATAESRTLRLYFAPRGPQDRIVFFSQDHSAQQELRLSRFPESNDSVRIEIPRFASGFLIRSEQVTSNALDLTQMPGAEPRARVEVEENPWSGFWFALGFTSKPSIEVTLVPLPEGTEPTPAKPR